MASLGPAYLIHGDDHGAVSERRARLRAVAERDDAVTSIDYLSGAEASPEQLALALAAMCLGVGRRVIVVDGVERWREDKLAELARAMVPMPADTTVALFAYEDARAKAPTALHELVKQAGGQVAREATLKARELPAWVRSQGKALGLELDRQAASALVAQVGERRQRLTRELEKLSLELAADAAAPVALGAEQIEARAARSAQWQIFKLADALLGENAGEAIGAMVRLRGQGERAASMLYPLSRRVRDALAAAIRLEHGDPASSVAQTLRMPPWAAKRLLEDARKAGPERLQGALGVLADLELHTRGGPVVQAQRPAGAALEEDTLVLRALLAIAED
jgi:DNA polymerase-3 subunit delta